MFATFWYNYSSSTEKFQTLRDFQELGKQGSKFFSDSLFFSVPLICLQVLKVLSIGSVESERVRMIRVKFEIF